TRLSLLGQSLAIGTVRIAFRSFAPCGLHHIESEALILSGALLALASGYFVYAYGPMGGALRLFLTILPNVDFSYASLANALMLWPLFYALVAGVQSLLRIFASTVNYRRQCTCLVALTVIPA